MSDRTTWQDMGLDARVIRAISRLNWHSPTPVQESAIPYALEGKDVLAKARTGSGKTAAYAVPVVQKILSKKEVRPLPLHFIHPNPGHRQERHLCSRLGSFHRACPTSVHSTLRPCVLLFSVALSLVHHL
jgi:hypothetical protein